MGPAAMKGPAPEAAEEEVRTSINEIVDPCSCASGVPIGLCDMGIVEAVDVNEGAVEVRLVPTSPGCLFVGLFEDAIIEKVLALGWCTSVDVEFGDTSNVWDETRLSAGARERLRRARAASRAELEQNGRIEPWGS